MGNLYIIVLTVYIWIQWNHRVENYSQVPWTPIHIDHKDRLDLWTVTNTGCECPGGRFNNCACCAKPGACLCSFNHNQCAQCGLEDSCQRFCNVTISSKRIATRSGLSWVHLKSPEIQGPAACWWKLKGAPGQRIEVQVHQLISVGAYSNSSKRCMGGYLQFQNGDATEALSQATKLCAKNGHFDPPIVLFGDRNTATLLLKTVAANRRTRFVAYISFTSRDDPVLGDPNRGGRILPYSDCDWTYNRCWERRCVLASPGYPGLFPPNQSCRYFINGNSTTEKIVLNFTHLNLSPEKMCSTYQVSVWGINSTAEDTIELPLKTLCHNDSRELEVPYSRALVHFKSGSTLSPYKFTGFSASVRFVQKKGQRLDHKVIDEPLIPIFTEYSGIPKIPHLPFHLDRDSPTPDDTEDFTTYENENSVSLDYGLEEDLHFMPISCGHKFKRGITAGGMFRLNVPRDLHSLGKFKLNHGENHGHPQLGNERESLAHAPFQCQVEFQGGQNDIIQLAVIKYNLRGSTCISQALIYNINTLALNGTGERLLGRLCGPSGNEVKKFSSSHNRLVLLLSIYPFDTLIEEEFLEGGFSFHDESLEGTMKPMSSCETVFYGVTSPPTGTIMGPPSSFMLQLSSIPFICAYSFITGLNQSVYLTLTKAGHDTALISLPGSKKYCRTLCTALGCRCEAKYTPLQEIDHLLVLDNNVPVACLCGYFPDALPMTFESQQPLSLIYQGTSYSLRNHEFSYAASFSFKNNDTCKNFTIQPPSSSIRWRDLLGTWGNSADARSVSKYTLFHCIWPVHVPLQYNLSLYFVSEEIENDCRIWNLTFWVGLPRAKEPKDTYMLSVFCPKGEKKEIIVPKSVSFGYIKFLGVTTRPPKFEIRWKYENVLLGSGFLTTTGSSYSLTCTHFSFFLFFTLLPFFWIQYNTKL